MKTRFHLAFATSNLMKAKDFYGGLLQCQPGRESTNWIDFNFFGHQLTIQYVTNKNYEAPDQFHPGTGLPLNHWGLVMQWDDWHDLKNRLDKSGVVFEVEPQLIMEGEIGEQHILMLKDPDGNIIEFKTFEDPDAVFRRNAD